MSAFDVFVLSKLAEATKSWEMGTRHATDVKRLFDAGPLNSDDLPPALGISLGNLARLGCAFPGSGFDAAVIFRYMTVTALGMALYHACS